MTWSVYQHWDPLKVCVVGRTYPPEFYSWIKVSHVRNLFEKIAIETEEDYQNIIKKLNEFGVEVLRPDLPDDIGVLKYQSNRYQPPPMTPRDDMIMIGKKFYANRYDFAASYNRIKDPSWPECYSWAEFESLPKFIKDECISIHHLDKHVPINSTHSCYNRIEEIIKAQGNSITYSFDDSVNGAMVSRIGKDLYFGTKSYDQDVLLLKNKMDLEFVETRNHIVNTGGHSDGTYCPVCPGLIISLEDVPSYADTYPGWEVIYLPGQSWDMVKPFLDLKNKNGGKWWIPGFEADQAVIDTVETWLSHWVGYVEETVFDVNMLILDPKNVMVFNYNKQVFDALNRYGITPHIVPFRHRYFWDGGIHCVTVDLHRDGIMQDFFPGRNL